jgi:hypothetical protein
MSEVELSGISSDSKFQIGPLLVQLFRSKTAIDNLFWANKKTPEIPAWLLDKKIVALICKWLQATSADAQGDEKTKHWLNELMAGGQDRVKTLVEPSVIRMAHYCFKEDSGVDLTYATFQIVETFVSEVRLLYLYLLPLLTPSY